MNNEQQDSSQEEFIPDRLSIGLTVLSFCIPIVGVIIYFSDKDSMPNTARSACYAAWWGIGFGVFINFLGRSCGVS